MPKWNKCINEEGCSASVAWPTWKGQSSRRKLISLAPTRASAVTEGERLLETSDPEQHHTEGRISGNTCGPGAPAGGLTRVSAPHRASSCLRSTMESGHTGRAEDPAAAPGVPRVSSSCCCPPCPCSNLRYSRLYAPANQAHFGVHLIQTSKTSSGLRPLQRTFFTCVGCQVVRDPSQSWCSGFPFLCPLPFILRHLDLRRRPSHRCVSQSCFARVARRNSCFLASLLQRELPLNHRPIFNPELCEVFHNQH